MNMDILELVETKKEKLVHCRRDLHKHPETAWTEFRTAAIVAETLVGLGYQVAVGEAVINPEDMMGVPSEHVFMDHAGISTYDSIYRAKEIFQADKIIIVTQKYHLYRALNTAKFLGVEAYGVSADVRVYAGQDLRDLREKAARVKDFVMAIFKPEPKFLGGSIPVSGNGDVTNDN